MKKFATLSVLVLSLFSAASVFAQSDAPAGEAASAEPTKAFWIIPDGEAGKAIGVALGVALIVMGAAKGIGRIGSAAVESMARQPEVAGNIFTAMLISCALIEGFTLLAVLLPVFAGALT